MDKVGRWLGRRWMSKTEVGRVVAETGKGQPGNFYSTARFGRPKSGGRVGETIVICWLVHGRSLHSCSFCNDKPRVIQTHTTSPHRHIKTVSQPTAHITQNGFLQDLPSYRSRRCASKSDLSRSASALTDPRVVLSVFVVLMSLPTRHPSYPHDIGCDVPA